MSYKFIEETYEDYVHEKPKNIIKDYGTTSNTTIETDHKQVWADVYVKMAVKGKEKTQEEKQRETKKEE